MSTDEKKLVEIAPRKKGRASEGKMSLDALRARARQLSLREQLERQHFLLERLNAASSRLVQAVEQRDVFEAIGEIIGNLVGSEEVAIFGYQPTEHRFSKAWSVGVDDATLHQLSLGSGFIGRAAQQGASQFRSFQGGVSTLPWEEKLTGCVVLKSDRVVVGVIVILGLLPQKDGLDWVDFQLLKFLETYGAVAVQLQSL